MTDPAPRCDRWVSGLCREFEARPVRCPFARAEGAEPGECCHHPLRELREAGVNLSRYGDRLRADPDFAGKLYGAFSRARTKRSNAARRTSGRS